MPIELGPNNGRGDDEGTTPFPLELSDVDPLSAVAFVQHPVPLREAIEVLQHLEYLQREGGGLPKVLAGLELLDLNINLSSAEVVFFGIYKPTPGAVVEKMCVFKKAKS